MKKILPILLVVAGSVGLVIFRIALRADSARLDSFNYLSVQTPPDKIYSNSDFGFSFAYPETFFLGNTEESPNTLYAELCQESCFMSAGNFFLLTGKQSLNSFDYSKGWRILGKESNPPKVISSQDILIGPLKVQAVERVVEYSFSSIERRTWIQISIDNSLLSFSFDPSQEPGKTVLRTFRAGNTSISQP
jgi:hypothetical protein